MLLYTTPGAVSPARVHFFLAEKGVEIETRTVNLMKGEHKTPEYRAIVPNGRSPALQLDDGTVLCETVAICRYLESLHPEPCLMGADPVERARIEMYDRMMEMELMMPMAMTFRHTHPAMAVLEDQVAEYGEKQRAVAESRLRRLDRELGEREWIAGAAFSNADITAWCALRFFGLAGFKATDATPNLLRWATAVGERPAARASTLR